MSKTTDALLEQQQAINDDIDIDYGSPEPDHQEKCPDCGKMADVYFQGNGPDDYVSRLVCSHCGADIQD